MTEAWSELRSNLLGAWEIMWGRPQGLDRLDLSVEGFWRSFAAILLVVPFVGLAMMTERALVAASGEAPPPFTTSVLGANALALLIDWLAFPLVFALLAKPLGMADRYVPFIVARNWASAPVAAIGASIGAIGLIGTPPPALLFILAVAAISLMLRFSYVVARTALAVAMSSALPIVIFDILLSLTIWSLVAPAS